MLRVLKISVLLFLHFQKESGKRKRVNLGIGEKLELIKKLESGVSVVRICDEHGVKKQTVSDIQRSKDKLTSYAMKFDVDPSKDKKGAAHKRKLVKVHKSRIGRNGLQVARATEFSERERECVRNR